MKIRQARAADAEALMAIQNPVIRDSAITFNAQEKTAAEYHRDIRDLPCFLVAEEGGEVLGFVSYLPFRRGIGYARTVEHTIVLSEAARGRGVGRALMAAAEARARAQGMGSIWAGVSGENPGGVDFHARLGFEKVAVLPKVGFKFGRWMDLVLMRKWLGDADTPKT
ncbi:MAG: GNAT family N-acetyltransferase [Silicimonas sp.]|nr:GNAT family N-acetyltransferase [Silicimonas sp.]